MVKVNHFNCKRRKKFQWDHCVKFVLAIIDSIFFLAKLDTKGGGSEGFVSVDAKVTLSIISSFFNISLSDLVSHLKYRLQ